MRKMMIIAAIPLACFTGATAIAGPPTKPLPAETATAAQAEPQAADAGKPAPAPATPNDKAVVTKKVADEWGKYDTEKKGSLTQAQFAKWMADLRASAGQAPPDANWLGLAFTQTDANADKKVSEEELTRFLLTGA
jgi:hypothetical protein